MGCLVRRVILTYELLHYARNYSPQELSPSTFTGKTSLIHYYVLIGNDPLDFLAVEHLETFRSFIILKHFSGEILKVYLNLP